MVLVHYGLVLLVLSLLAHSNRRNSSWFTLFPGQAMVKSVRRNIETRTETADDIISKLKSSLSSGEKRVIKFLLPYAKRAVGRRELGKVCLSYLQLLLF